MTPQIKTPTARQRKLYVAVAQDVLALLPDMDVRSGYSTLAEKPLSNLDDPAALRITEKEDIPRVARHCSVCAKGAMVLAHIHLYNGVTQVPARRDAREYGDKIFGQHWHAIEEAFEGDKHGWDFAYRNPKERLAAIMQNIIDNKGRFMPSRQEVSQ